MDTQSNQHQHLQLMQLSTVSENRRTATSGWPADQPRRMLNTPPAGLPLLPLVGQPIHVAFVIRSILSRFVRADRARKSGFRMKEQSPNHVACATWSILTTFVNADQARKSGFRMKKHSPNHVAFATWSILTTFVNADRARNSGFWMKVQNSGAWQVDRVLSPACEFNFTLLLNEPGTPRSKDFIPLGGGDQNHEL